MATTTVRKFGLSIDPDETVDFAEDVEWFNARLTKIGFEHNNTYTFRYRDTECMMKIELKESQDGYFAYLYVQANDEHLFRAKEVAEALEAYVVDTSGTKRYSLKDDSNG